MKNFFKKIVDWCKTHIWQSAVIGAVTVGVVATAIAVPIALSNKEPAHQHTFASDWSSDGEKHWHAATCEHSGEATDFASHTFVNGICSVCGYEKVIPHQHTFSESWSHDETKHWHAATCEHSGEATDFASHTFVNGICSVCGYEKLIPHEHTFSESWSHDETNHWHAATCEHTSEKGNLGNHIDVNDDFVCDICDYHMPNPSANEVDATEFAEALDFNTLNNFKGHYSYYSLDLVNPTSQYDFEQDGNVAKMIYSNEDQYIEYKDGAYILYYYQTSKWHKGPAAFYQTLISDSIISWKDTLEYSDFIYNSESKTYSSESDGYEFELKFDLLGGKKSLVSFDVVVFGSDRYLFEFSSYGDASLVLPEIDV